MIPIIEPTECIGNSLDTINLSISTVNSLSAQSTAWNSVYTTTNMSSASWFNTHYLVLERSEYGESTFYDGLTSFTPVATRLYTRQLNDLREYNTYVPAGMFITLDKSTHYITFQPGAYLIEATAPHKDAGLTKLLFGNVDDTGDHIVGAQSNSYIQTDQFTQGFSTATLVGYVTVAPGDAKTYGLFQYISNKTSYTSLAQPVCAAVSYATDLGQAYLEEIYATVKITLVT